MRYMMLIYTVEGDVRATPPAEIEQIKAGHAAVMHDSREQGVLVAVNSLGRTSTAKTVRVEGGNILATDGPFAETREQLAGYYVIDCHDMQEAIAWAARIPTGCGGGKGSIEIRELGEFPGVPESVVKPHPAWATVSE